MIATKPRTSGRPTIHPIAMVKVKLCACTLTEPMKAVTHDGGKHWEVIALHPVFRDCVLHFDDVEIVKP